MATYVLLTKLSPSSMGTSETRETIGREWFKAVKAKCPEVKWLEHFALLGAYDFMDIYEAPDEEVAAKVSMITMTKGAVTAQSMPAIPYKKYLELVKEL